MPNEHQGSEYVGLNPSGDPTASAAGSTTLLSSSPAPPLPPSRISTYIQIAVCLLLLRLVYEFHRPLAFFAFLVFGIFVCYQYSQQSTQAAERHNARFDMDRINREREESEQMMAEAARMMLDINRRHLEEFLITHPSASYEQWIGNLHPENVDTTKNNEIDHRFYVADSDHRLLWNEMVGDSERESVPARTNVKNGRDLETGA